MLHAPAFIQDEEPIGVQAGIGWIDTSGGDGNWVLKVKRTDGAWETIATGGGSGTDDHSELTNLGYDDAGHTGFGRLPLLNAGAPTSDFDASDTANVGVEFRAGDQVIDTSATPAEVWECTDPATGSAVWSNLSAQAAGDMTKAVYDTDDSGVVDESESTQALNGWPLADALEPDDGDTWVFDGAAKAWKHSAPAAGAATLPELTDGPAGYGTAGQVPATNGTEDGWEWVDQTPAYDGNIATLDIDGGTDIGGALADADLIVVDDGAGGTNRKCAMSRVKTYAQGIKLDDLTAPDDNTDLNASTSKHGLLLKGDNSKYNVLLGTVAWGAADAAIKRIVTIQVIADATTLTTGDGKAYLFIPSDLNGWNLVDADACVTTVGTGATLTTIQIHNLTDGNDMLSTRITLDASEKTSFTAATQPVINTTYDDVATGDQLRIDVDAIANTTAPKGLSVILVFQKP
jgi:hypothetical protein